MGVEQLTAWPQREEAATIPLDCKVYCPGALEVAGGLVTGQIGNCGPAFQAPCPIEPSPTTTSKTENFQARVSSPLHRQHYKHYLRQPYRLLWRGLFSRCA